MKKIVIVLGAILLGIWTVGCKSQSQIFNKKEVETIKGHQEALAGQWLITKHETTEGKILFDFSVNDKDEISLSINNNAVEVLDFQLLGPLDFIVVYTDEMDETQKFLGRFQSYNRSTLLVMNTGQSWNLGDQQSLTLEKVSTDTELTASIKKN